MGGGPYRCGEAATDALRVLIGADPVRCEGDTLDRYKRLIAICFAGGKDLNAEMVRQGWARWNSLECRTPDNLPRRRQIA